VLLITKEIICLDKRVKVEHLITMRTHKPIGLRFWARVWCLPCFPGSTKGVTEAAGQLRRKQQRLLCSNDITMTRWLEVKMTSCLCIVNFFVNYFLYQVAFLIVKREFIESLFKEMVYIFIW